MKIKKVDIKNCKGHKKITKCNLRAHISQNIMIKTIKMRFLA